MALVATPQVLLRIPDIYLTALAESTPADPALLPGPVAGFVAKAIAYGRELRHGFKSCQYVRVFRGKRQLAGTEVARPLDSGPVRVWRTELKPMLSSGAWRERRRLILATDGQVLVIGYAKGPLFQVPFPDLIKLKESPFVPFYEVEQTHFRDVVSTPSQIINAALCPGKTLCTVLVMKRDTSKQYVVLIWMPKPMSCYPAYE